MTYEEKYKKIQNDAKKAKRKIMLIAAPIFVFAVAVFVVGCSVNLSWVAAYLIFSLVVIAFTAKQAVSKIGVITAGQKHQLQLLESEEPFSKFKHK